MPTDEDLDDALEKIREFVIDINDEIIGPIDEEVFGVENGPPRGFTCNHGDHDYVIVGTSGQRFMSIIVPRGLISTIATNLSEDEVEDLLKDAEPPQIEVGGPVDKEKFQAAIIWVNSVDQAVMDEIIFHLKDRISHPLVSYTVETLDSGALSQYNVQKKIFPFEDDFGISEFESAVQSVISVGANCDRFIAEAFNLDAESFEPEGARIPR